ncbi:MAG: class I SAM-dependent rRNA methyltransferase [Bdellovibrionales bacterium]|nr:class I SAM-dependent rRNA methyltransferase [Bdellovibrionales bacterium]
MKELEAALQMRVAKRLFVDTEALRIFYGPGESRDANLKHVAVDVFKDQLWVTLWQRLPEKFVNDLKTALQSLKLPSGFAATGAVLMDRSEVASEKDSVQFFGTSTVEYFACREFGAQYAIRMLGTKHPGLFLDHAPLRRWLLDTQKGKTALNLFSYTGSLSIAAAVGGASKVTTLDLSKATIEWAKENWKLNSLADERGDFIYGDAFEWLNKMAKRGDRFDTVISDPPSFSRSKNGIFSTQKDLVRLHVSLFSVVAPGGTLVTSINSENVSEEQYLRDIQEAAKKAGVKFKVDRKVSLPPSFPNSDYLKGFYLTRT